MHLDGKQIELKVTALTLSITFYILIFGKNFHL